MERDKEKMVSIKRPLLLTLLAASFALGVFVGAGMGVFSFSTVSRNDSVLNNGRHIQVYPCLEN